jgi:hypothetical protein
MDVETTTQNPGADVITLEGFGAATKPFSGVCYGRREPFRLTQPPLKKR